MDKYFNFQNTMILLVLFIALSLINTCNSCKSNQSSKNNQTEIHKLDSSTNVLDSTIHSDFYNKRELNLRMEIEGLRISKRILYDWNAIVRTYIRPDDVMNEYDKMIELLQKELDEIKK